MNFRRFFLKLFSRFLNDLNFRNVVITVEESEPEEDDDEKILKECYEMFQAYSEPVDLQSTQQVCILSNYNISILIQKIF